MYNIIMLAQKYRFHSRGGVRHTYQKGKTIRTQIMSLVFAPNSRYHQRFGVVVSKKVLKSAVGRNRIRRRIYEAIRLELPNFTKFQDNIFIVYQKSVLTMSFRELRELIHDLLARSLTE